MASVAEKPQTAAAATAKTAPPAASSTASPAPAVASPAARRANTTTTPTPTTSAAAAAALSRANNKLCDLMPSASQCSYWSCFCEENVWKLCEHVHKSSSPNELSKAWVVFVSNKKQVVPLWRQKAGKDEEKLVIWDYHVLFLYKPDEKTLVFDLDSDLPFPTYFHKYVTETFRTDAILNPEYHRFFRVVPATVFYTRFASDRRHMRKPDGTWMKPPPSYPAIQTQDSKHNLDDFISMDKAVGVGEILSLKEFVQRFYRN